jgi:hypothetical protein
MRLLLFKYRDVFLNAMAVVLLFCYSITNAVRRWLKTQAAAKTVATNEAVHLRRRKITPTQILHNQS